MYSANNIFEKNRILLASFYAPLTTIVAFPSSTQPTIMSAPLRSPLNVSARLTQPVVRTSNWKGEREGARLANTRENAAKRWVGARLQWVHVGRYRLHSPVVSAPAKTLHPGESFKFRTCSTVSRVTNFYWRVRQSTNDDWSRPSVRPFVSIINFD